MTALLAQRTPGLWKKFQTLSALVAADEVIFKGAQCGFKGGYLYHWVDGDPDLLHPCIAIPQLHKGGGDGTKVDNTGGADGDLVCEVDFGEEKTCYLFANDGTAPVTQADVGGDAWGADDQTVSALGTNRSRVGTPWFVQGSNQLGFRVGVYVEFDGAANPDTIALQSAIVAPLRVVRNVVFGNVANLAAYAVAASTTLNDNVLGVASDVVALVAQTAPTQNGLYRIGTVAAGAAPLTRVADMPTGAVIPNGVCVEVSEGGVYGGSTWKSRSTQLGGWTVGTHDPTFYPRQYRQTVTLAAGTYTIGAGSTATPDEPLFLFAGAMVGHSLNTGAGTLGTNKISAPSASRITGIAGTARVIINSLVDAGTVAGSDTSTVDVTINNG